MFDQSSTIPKGWTESRLGKIVQFQRGFDLPTQNRIIGKYPMVVSNGIDGFVKEYKVKGPGVITGRSGSLGTVLFIKDNFWPLNTTLWVKDFNDNDKKFIYYWLLRFPFEKYNAGTGVPTLNRNHIHEVEVLVPGDTREQLAISAVLSSLDDKIELLREQNKTLESIAQAIFKEWFVNFNFPGSTGKMIDSELGEIPEGWRVGKMGEELSVAIGGDWGEETKTNSDDVQAYCLRGTDIGSLKLNGYSAQVPIRWIRKNSLEKRTITENAILIAGSGLGPIGKTVYCHRNINLLYGLPITYSNFCKRLTTKNKYHALYFEYLISALYSRGALGRFSIGTSIPNLDINGLLEEKVIIPIEKYMEDFSKILDVKYSKLMNPQIQTLSTLRDTLLPKLMKGEVRVEGFAH